MDFGIFLDHAFDIGKKVFNVVRDNVKIGVDVTVDTPFTDNQKYHIDSDQVADKLEQMIWEEESEEREIIHPIYFMNDNEVKRIQDEANRRP